MIEKPLDWEQQKLDQEVRASVCGHITQRKGTAVLFGSPTEVECSEAIPDYCFDCLPKKVIRCATCEAVIYPMELVTLYVYSKQRLDDLPEYAVKHKGSAAGCMHCAELGIADAAARWEPDNGGIVVRPYEELVPVTFVS